jgi:signal transduction histidine kinase
MDLTFSANRFFFLLLIFLSTIARAEEAVFSGKDLALGTSIEVLNDSSRSLTFSDVLKSKKFVPNKDFTPNFGLSNSTFWLRFTILNNSDDDKVFLELANPRITSSVLYSQLNGQEQSEFISIDSSFNSRKIKHPNIVYELFIPRQIRTEYYLKIESNEQIVLPLTLRSETNFLEYILSNEIISGIHIGILFVMMLYNFFLYLSIKEKNYLYYVLYILFICLTQTTITGYTFKFLWPDTPAFNKFAIIILPALAGIFAILFFQSFLHTREKSRKIHNIMIGVIIIYLSSILFILMGWERLSFRIIDISAVTAAALALTASAQLSLKKNRPARFFFVSWLIFLIGIVLYTMRNLDFLPYNTFTNYTMHAGTAIEVVLLSFALVDRINILRREKEISQAQALKISLENERIITNQNAFLEKSVDERTAELRLANEELNLALTKLKDAQTQLIDSEKMASLGQLTAGIAHEINNPINFVSSNIRPLRRDIDDLIEIVDAYEGLHSSPWGDNSDVKLKEINQLKDELDLDYIKTELDVLLKGMADGAQRTVEIVKGLKMFARVDDTDLNMVNINEGIESTLVILNYQMGTSLKLIKELGSIPNIEGYGGKLNQVFMNILTNSIYVIQNDPTNTEPTIWVKTWLSDPDHVSISIKDNGTGMTPEVKAKIFEPFFTTKQVGEGTGLGLSIVFKIIDVHNGNIAVNTEPGNGTEFIITLPILKKKNPILVINE